MVKIALHHLQERQMNELRGSFRPKAEGTAWQLYTYSARLPEVLSNFFRSHQPAVNENKSVLRGLYQGCDSGKFEDGSGSDILSDYGSGSDLGSGLSSGSSSGSGSYTSIYIYVYVYVYIFVNVYICIY
jgi:hypothetical protein